MMDRVSEGLEAGRRVAWARYYELEECVSAGCSVDCGWCGSTTTIAFRDGRWQGWTTGPRVAGPKPPPSSHSIAAIRARLMGPKRIQTGTGWPA